jgi:phenylalanyl-tRNA synthetase beta chain
MRLGWQFSRDKQEFAISSPWERTDLTIPEEFVEEIGRVYGYKNITGVLPPLATQKPTSAASPSSVHAS